MSNLLPIPSQKEVWRMYRARFVMVAAIMIFALSLVAGVALAPSYLALEIAAPAAQGGETAAKPDAKETIDVARAQALIAAMLPLLSSTSSPAQYMNAALNDRPSGISIDSVSYSAENASIMVAGSGTREQINAYRTALMQDKNFRTVSVPVGSLVGVDGRFSITISL